MSKIYLNFKNTKTLFKQVLSRCKSSCSYGAVWYSKRCTEPCCHCVT